MASEQQQDRVTHAMDFDGKGWLIQLFVTVVIITLVMFYLGVLP